MTHPRKKNVYETKKKIGPRPWKFWANGTFPNILVPKFCVPKYNESRMLVQQFAPTFELKSTLACFLCLGWCELKYRSVICCCTFGTLGQYLEGNICTSGELGHFQNYWICFKDESCQAVGSERGVLEGFNEDMRKTPMSMMIIINIIIVITIIIIMLGDSGNPLPWFPRIWGGGLDLLHRGKTIPTPPQCAQWVK